MEKAEEKDIYECPRCDYIGHLDTFTDTECDGDVIGTCPCCRTNGVICEVTTEQDEEIL